MSTTIYYFSTTGNSLTTAKLLADELEQSKLVSVLSHKNDSQIINNSKYIGFVFPVYYSSIPYPVRETILKMVFNPKAYIFIFTTFRKEEGDAAKKIDQILRAKDQKLSLALGIPMPGNSVMNNAQEDKTCLNQQRKRIYELVQFIKNREIRDYYSCEVFPQQPVDFPNNFRGIMTGDQCIGCSLCVEICPMNNIIIKESKAFIGDNCATCLACFHWCPVEAVYMSKEQNISRRRKYHHPDVSLKDITW